MAKFRKNQLSSLPSDFHCLLNLIQLDLAENQFSKFPEGLSGLHKLENLILRSNMIQSLHNNTVKRLPNLSHVDLRDNKLTLLPRNLERLHIFCIGERQICRNLDEKSLQKVDKMRKKQKCD